MVLEALLGFATLVFFFCSWAGLCCRRAAASLVGATLPTLPGPVKPADDAHEEPGGKDAHEGPVDTLEGPVADSCESSDDNEPMPMLEPIPKPHSARGPGNLGRRRKRWNKRFSSRLEPLDEALEFLGALDEERGGEALRAPRATTAFIQQLLDPRGPDEFIRSATRAQQALEHMKDFAKGVKAQHVLQAQLRGADEGPGSGTGEGPVNGADENPVSGADEEPMSVLEAKEALRMLDVAAVHKHSMSEADRKLVEGLEDDPEILRSFHERVLLEHGCLLQAYDPVSQA